MSRQPSLAVYYEHPTWFRPLFAELDRQGLPYSVIRADRMVFDPAAELESGVSLVVNRMSPSAWERGVGGAVFFTQHYLEHLEAQGVEVINGAGAYRYDISKGLQLSLLERLGLGVPRTRLVNRPMQLLQAVGDLRFPLLVKPNIGGNGAGVERFESAAELARAVEVGRVVAGPDGVVLLQEYHPPADGIFRVETLGGRFLYALRIDPGSSDAFKLCPADLCSTTDGRRLASSARLPGAGGEARVEAFDPGPEVIAEVERIAIAAGLDIGGVEYLVSARDGRRYYYDVNALSNFVAEPETVLGFDPTARFVDALAARLVQRAA